MDHGDEMVGTVLGCLVTEMSCDLSNPENVRDVEVSLSIDCFRPSTELGAESCSGPPAQRFGSTRNAPRSKGLVGGGLPLKGLPLGMEAVAFAGAVKMLRGVALAAVVREKVAGELGGKPELHTSPRAAGVRSHLSVLPKAGAVLGVPKMSRGPAFCCCR